MEGEWEGKRNHARMLLSEVSIPDLGSAQPTAHESHRHNRQAGSSIFSPVQKAEEATEGYSGAGPCWSYRQRIREVRTQLDLKLVRNGNGNKKNL